MAYVQLDSSGNVDGVFANPQPGNPAYAEIADIDPRIAAWQAKTTATAAAAAKAQQFAASDYQMARGHEELVALLITKGVIARTDLSAAQLADVNARRALRGEAAL